MTGRRRYRIGIANSWWDDVAPLTAAQPGGRYISAGGVSHRTARVLKVCFALQRSFSTAVPYERILYETDSETANDRFSSLAIGLNMSVPRIW